MIPEFEADEILADLDTRLNSAQSFINGLETKIKPSDPALTPQNRKIVCDSLKKVLASMDDCMKATKDALDLLSAFDKARVLRRIALLEDQRLSILDIQFDLMNPT